MRMTASLVAGSAPAPETWLEYVDDASVLCAEYA